MVRRQLGCSGLAVSPIGLGTTKLGRNTDVKYPVGFALPSDDQIAALLESAGKLGVNLIDTAPAYGDSERRLGGFIEAHRDEIVLCTKCGEQYVNGQSIYDFSATAIVASVEESLRRLRTHYIDVMLLHSDGRDVEILTQTEVLAALARLKTSGKIRAAGISAKTASGILEASRTLDVIMAPFSEQETGLADALAIAHDRGLGVLAIKGLFSGHLEARSAIEFVLRQPFIDALIVGTINPGHLKDAVAVAQELFGSG
jgi:aryl-alcohol dehydrogenase-like predicted oxidoreductase